MYKTKVIITVILANKLKVMLDCIQYYSKIIITFSNQTILDTRTPPQPNSPWANVEIFLNFSNWIFVGQLVVILPKGPLRRIFVKN